MRPAYLSASQLNCYLGCPAKYQFRYLDRVEPAFKSAALVLGSAVHSTLEWIHRGWQAGEEPSWEEIAEIFEADLSAQAMDPISFRDGAGFKSLLQQGCQLLLVYVTETPARPPKAMEVPFEVELIHPKTGEILDIPLRGWMDLIEADGTVVEFKTAARKPDKTTLALHLQLSAYSYAGKTIYRKRPKLRLDCLMKTKVPRLERIPVERTETDDGRLFVIATEVVKAIDAESFFPNPGWQCQGCEYRHVCPIWT